MSATNDGYMEVYFAQYCPSCKYHKYPEEAEPCVDCLDEPMQFESHKPEYYEKAVNKDQKSYKREFSKEEKNYVRAISNVFEI